MFAKGDYVRLRMAPNTRMGTIEDSKVERGRTLYHFLQNQRFHEADGVVYRGWHLEVELERCARPSNEHVDKINKAMAYGS